jgi:hypothetical protein
MTEIQVQIVRAIEAGRLDELRRLQAEYRRTAVVESADRGGPALPVRLIESPAARKMGSKELNFRPPSWHLPDGSGSFDPKPSRTTITITSSAREVILAEIDRAWAELVEGVETGGHLYGDLTRVRVATVSGQSGHGFLRLGDAEEARTGTQLVGDWHTHATVGPPTPSHVDVQGWTKAAEALGRDYLGIIASSFVARRRGRAFRLDRPPPGRARRLRSRPSPLKGSEMPNTTNYPVSPKQPSPKVTTWPAKITKAPAPVPK